VPHEVLTGHAVATITEALPALPSAEARRYPDRQPAEATGADLIEPLPPGPTSRLANFGSGPLAAEAEIAMGESCSLSELPGVIQSLAHVLRECSDELADRSFALQARSRELQHRVHALRKR